MRAQMRNSLPVFLLLAFLPAAFAASSGTRPVSRTKSRSVTESSATARKLTRARHSRAHRHVAYERFYTSSYATDQVAGDIAGGEDPVVRQAAIDALAAMNGTIVAIDPESGRILAMVNQKLALSEGAEPCSTIKLSVALAALSEGIINKDTPVRLPGGGRMNLTRALAVSNNLYFEALGRKLGFEKMSYYAHQLGLGELAGWNIPQEHLGQYPAEELPQKLGGVGRMCSFGESISMTPLHLGALVAAISNGGTLYYLQHPGTPEEVVAFKPVIKRQLDIAPLIPEMSEGMAAAVDYGTARTLHYNFNEVQVLGKTGTCSNAGTRFGWFASYANTGFGRIVTVVFLRGDRGVYGPKAAELAGRMYRNLYDHSFFAGSIVPSAAAAASRGANQ
ncbi:MAG: penicillin-binding protein [Acidobacteria bacterium]|nr:penicillin-binding protein [Acidobacteriota bacterium]